MPVWFRVARSNISATVFEFIYVYEFWSMSSFVSKFFQIIFGFGYFSMVHTKLTISNSSIVMFFDSLNSCGPSEKR